MTDVNTGDVLFQLFMLLSLLVPAAAVFFVVKNGSRTKQLNRIEKKLDERK